jgi:hypothetical protein
LPYSLQRVALPPNQLTMAPARSAATDGAPMCSESPGADLARHAFPLTAVSKVPDTPPPSGGCSRIALVGLAWGGRVGFHRGCGAAGGPIVRRLPKANSYHLYLPKVLGNFSPPKGVYPSEVQRFTSIGLFQGAGPPSASLEGEPKPYLRHIIGDIRLHNRRPEKAFLSALQVSCWHQQVRKSVRTNQTLG